MRAARRWLGAALLGVVAWAAAPAAEPVITELMAANNATLADDDGIFSDWVEIHNPDTEDLNLEGWYLTDNATNKTKWRFPAVTVPAGGYLVVFASNQNRANPAAPLHTNFALSAGGEYLGLIKPDEQTVASEFAPGFPGQRDDVSYGRVLLSSGRWRAGFLRTPSPGAPNGGPEALLLSEAVSFSRASGPFTGSIVLELSGASSEQVIRYVLASGGGQGEAEVTSNSPEYTGPITLSSTALVRAAVFSADGGTHGRVTSAHYLRISDDAAAFATRLPVLVVDNLGAGGLVKDRIDHASWMYGYTPAGAGESPVFEGPPQLATPLVATVRGESSAEFPKKGYNLKLRDEEGNKRALPLVQLPAYEKWALVAPWSFDQNLINNAFVYSLSNRIGRWAPRTQFVELFFNADGGDLDASDYAGVYVVTDRIEPAPGRVDIPVLSASHNTPPAITGGYLLKIDALTASDQGWRTSHNFPEDDFSAVIMVAPEADEATPEQREYIRSYIQEMEDALYDDRESGWKRRTYLDFIDRASWVDHHLLNVFVSNPDAFVRSAYFTKPRNGRLQAGPVWDFDRALGSNWDYRQQTPTTWSGIDADVNLWRTNWFGILAEDPEFMQDWVDRWQGLRRTEFSTPNLMRLIDQLSGSIGAAAAARDSTRWPDNVSPHGDYAAQIDFMKDWLRQRARWIDEQFVAVPSVAESGGSLVFTPPAGAILVYTLDGSDPRSVGGAIAPNAQTSEGPVTLSASTNIQVRAYNAAQRDAFPGSPWSSAVGGAASSPLSPAGRLINVSIRGTVGAGENALITGIVVSDTKEKRYLARAVGPALGVFGTAGYVADPQLRIEHEGSELYRNNGWESNPNAAELAVLARTVGAFPLPPGSQDSALTATLAAGSYTVHVTTPTGQAGVGLTELYELDGQGRTSNISTRAWVGPAELGLTGGFVVRGPAHKRVLIRAVGPTLGAFGVGNALADPVLTLHRGATEIASNDRWEAGDHAPRIVAATTAIGAFALAPDSEDAALLITLAPGAYTVELTGKDEATGIALLEIYEVP